MHEGSKNVGFLVGLFVGRCHGFPVSRCVGFGVGWRGRTVGVAGTSTSTPRTRLNTVATYAYLWEYLTSLRRVTSGPTKSGSAVVRFGSSFTSHRRASFCGVPSVRAAVPEMANASSKSRLSCSSLGLYIIGGEAESFSAGAATKVPGFAIIAPEAAPPAKRRRRSRSIPACVSSIAVRLQDTYSPSFELFYLAHNVHAR